MANKAKKHWNEHRANKKSFQAFLTPEEVSVVDQAKSILGVVTAKELLLTLCNNILKSTKTSESKDVCIDQELQNYFKRDLDAEFLKERENSARRFVKSLLECGMNSYSSAAKELNDMAYPTLDGKTRWTWQKVKKLAK